jgi:hypothetical protein
MSNDFVRAYAQALREYMTVLCVQSAVTHPEGTPIGPSYVRVNFDFTGEPQGFHIGRFRGGTVYIHADEFGNRFPDVRTPMNF